MAARTVGGGAKGAMFSVPGLGTAKLAAGTVGIATAENYLHSAAKGDVSAEALGKALANGTIEGVTAGLVDVAAKKVLGTQPHAESKAKPELQMEPMTEAELESVIGGAGNPKWRPLGSDSINKVPYEPRAMEQMLKKDGDEVLSHTIPPINAKNAGLAETRHPATGVVFDERGFPIFDDVAKAEVRITGDLSTMKPDAHMRAATRQLRADIQAGKIDRSLFSDIELDDIMRGKAKVGEYTWHHHQDLGRMQLIHEDIHANTGHFGGNKLWRIK